MIKSAVGPCHILGSWYLLEIFTSKSLWEKKFIDDVILQFWLLSSEMVSGCKIYIGHLIKVVRSSINLCCQGVSLVQVSTSYHMWNSRFQGDLCPPPLQAGLGILRIKQPEVFNTFVHDVITLLYYEWTLSLSIRFVFYGSAKWGLLESICS